MTGLLVDELQWMVDQWTDGGAARLSATTGDLQKNLATIFTGMGSLSYGELAGERMKLGLMLHDPEDTTASVTTPTGRTTTMHWVSRNVYTGAYTRIDGSVLSGRAFRIWSQPTRDASGGQGRCVIIWTRRWRPCRCWSTFTQGGRAYDQMIGEGNTSGNAKGQGRRGCLVAQTRAIEKGRQYNGAGIDRL